MAPVASGASGTCFGRSKSSRASPARAASTEPLPGGDGDIPRVLDAYAASVDAAVRLNEVTARYRIAERSPAGGASREAGGRDSGLVLALSCRGDGEKEEKKESPSPASDAAPAAALAIKTERARLARLERNVNAPGHTVALVQQKVRAHFAGTLLGLSVIDGDRVRRGDSVGTIVSRDSEAAVAGAKRWSGRPGLPRNRKTLRRAIALADPKPDSRRHQSSRRRRRHHLTRPLRETG